MSKYSLSQVYHGLKHPDLIRGEINNIATNINKICHNYLKSSEGVDIAEADWDNLVVLDACRFDYFDDYYNGEGEVEKATSLGTMSEEFLLENFSESTHHDIVYVSANPYVSKLDNNTFHHVYKLYKNEWDEELQTVPPTTVAKAFERAIQEYPNKRIIGHFMQPHTPFIGEFGSKIVESEKNNTTERMSRSGPLEPRDIWSNLRYNLTEDTLEDVRTAYKENLEIVLECTDELIDNLPGKTILTADHGELLGDRLQPIPVRGFGHPRGIRDPSLTTVPWVEFNAESRRHIKAEPPEKTENTSDEVVQDRLQKLGYID